MALTQHSLDSGYDVRLRPVPPHAITDVLSSFPRPKYPVLHLQSAAGPSEMAPALEDSPEWQAWNAENTEWNKLCIDAIAQFTLTYGVLDYRKTGTDDPWVRGAPKEWKIPSMMDRYGIEDSEDKLVRWLQFIKYELIITESDEGKVDSVTNMRSSSPGEIDAALVPFDLSSE